MDNLVIDQGTVEEFDIIVRDSFGNAVNLDGQTLFMTAKKSFNDLDADAVFKLDSNGNGIIINPAQSVAVNTGHATIRIVPSNTSSLSATVWHLVYDIRRKTVSGDVVLVFKGQVIISPAITQST